MFQTLLIERFKLQTHRETREQPTYALVVARNGLKVSPVNPERDVEPGGTFTASGGGSAAQGVGVDLGRGSSYSLGNNRFEGRKLSMVMLARTLSPFVGRPVVDMTNTAGFFDLSAELTTVDYYGMLARSSEAAGAGLSPQAAQVIEMSTLDSLFAGLEKAGLVLEPRRMPREVLVIDSIEKMPTPN
jgi:uncharacterized protein (TIGR03435 family)